MMVTLWSRYKKLLKMAVEIDELSSYKMVDLSSSLRKRLPEGSGKSSRNGIIWWKSHGKIMEIICGVSSGKPARIHIKIG